MFEAPRQIQSALAPSGDVAVGPAPIAGIDLQRIRSVLWRGKTTTLWTTAASLLIAVLIVLVVPHRFTAVTQILIDPTDLHAVGNDPNPSNQTNDAAVLQVESQVRVLGSDSVLRRVISAESLDRDTEFVGRASALRGLLASFGLGGARNTDPALSAVNALKRKLQVKRAERTYVVDVSVTSQDPDKAARIANAVAQAYLAEQTAVRSDAARQISQSLSARLNELKDRVREAEDRVETYKARNNILGASGQLVNEQQLSELNNQLGAAHARTAAAKARVDQVERLQLSRDETGAFPEAVQSQTITALRSQYAEVMRREAEQMTSLGQRHPAVIEIQAEAARLRKMVEDEIHRIALAARSEYESARANEAALAANLETLKHSAVTRNEAMGTLRELERDVQASRAVYELFLVRAASRRTGAARTKNIRVISRANRRSAAVSRRPTFCSPSAPFSLGSAPVRYRHHAGHIRPGVAARRRHRPPQIGQRRQGISAVRRVVILHSGACSVAECRHLVRLERRGGSELAFRHGNPQNTGRGAGKPQNPRLYNDFCRRC